jgi:polar amino acid transport system ATP-binding protein
VRVRGLRKSFAGHTVLDGVDLDVREGEVTVLLGPSGAGKSTLLRCVNHLERPDAGFVEVGGEVVGYRPEGGCTNCARAPSPGSAPGSAWSSSSSTSSRT